MNKKAIGPVVATVLLLVVAVVAAVGFQNWYLSYSSSLFSKVESQVNVGSVTLEYLEPTKLYVRNYNNINLTVTDIRIGHKDCNLTGTVPAIGMGTLNLSDCLNNTNIGPKEVVLITKQGVFTQILMLKSVKFISPGNSTTTGAFSGYAWGEGFGYISFNGTGYQVLMKNNQLYGKAYSEYLGYISLNGTGYGVTNVNGVLTGYAWGSEIGYIHFNDSPIYQTTFNGTLLSGNAYSENYGYINFNFPTYYQIIYG